jgi:glycopeptide antibiotics resistance protein
VTVRRTLWLLFAAFIVYGATIPFHFAGGGRAVLDKLHRLPLNPLVSPDTGGRLSIPDVVQNVLLFVPFGALGFLAGTRTPRKPRRIVLVTLLGAALSVFVEILQLFTNDRVTSLGDVTANTIGTLLGAILAWLSARWFVVGLRRLHSEGLVIDELRPLAVAAVVLFVAFWQPFDVTLEVGVIVGKVHLLQQDAWQFTGLRDEGTSIMLAAFFAMTLASYLSALGERRVSIRTLALGSGFVCLLEASQILIGSRMPALWDAAVATSGIAIGVAIWSTAGRVIWPRLWLVVLVVVTLTAAALQMLSPFEMTATYHSFGWFPFFGYYVHTTFETLSHVIELMLLYFPLGFWLGASPSTSSDDAPVGSRRPRLNSIVLALTLTFLIAAPIEYLQGWVVGRYPDVTDVALSVVGGALGVWTGLAGRR